MTGDSHLTELKEIVDAVRIYSSTQYTFQNVMRDISAWQMNPSSYGVPYLNSLDLIKPNNEENSYPSLLNFIEQEIYSKLYHRPSPATPQKSFSISDDFISELSKANNGHGTWEPGWTIHAVEDDGRIIVSKDQVNYWVEPDGLITTAENIIPGSLCRVRIGKEMRYLCPGFYMGIGNSNAPDISGPLVRLYWNLTPKGAIHYIKLVTDQLNERQIPFRTKVVSDPGLYLRADAGVLYVEKALFLHIRKLILDIYQEIRIDLKPETPMFTKPLGEGLGLAEDPGNGSSFGISRCRIVARGLWLSYLQGQTDPEQRLSALISSFQAEGLNPERPYLEKGSDDIYILSDLS